MPLVKAARRALLLSGTPLLSKPLELFTQLHALRPRAFGNERDFSVRYCNGHQGRFGWEAKGSTHAAELNALLTHAVMIRREKKAALGSLPEKVRHKTPAAVEPSAQARLASKMEP